MNNLAVKVTIKRVEGEYVPIYAVHLPQVSPATEAALEQIRRDMVQIVDASVIDLVNPQKALKTKERFTEVIGNLVRKYFPDVNDETIKYLSAYLVQKSLGLGDIDTLSGDFQLEEIVINGAADNIWVYHRKHGWLKTNLKPRNENEVRQYASVIGRKVGRQINVLTPLMDANLPSGHRVNATLSPISSNGNTITIRQFSHKPWTITDMITSNTISLEMAALLWEAIHYELSILIAGGTASGKTSFLNALTNFFPPSQRILSIEDTREVRLASFLHWVPMSTRQPNAEGKGGVSMLDLLVNSLRQRPDRILVGEIRRKAEAEVLFEAIHTGHSVYATVHADSANETITRLTSPPIEIPKSMLPALDLIVVQYRNRRSGKRRTFQIAEITDKAEARLLAQYEAKKDHLLPVGSKKSFIEKIKVFTGLSSSEVEKEIKEKETVLKKLVKDNINTVEEVGKAVAEYYLRQ